MVANGCLHALQRIITGGAVYRAEKSLTKKHSAEFVGFDLEIEGVKSELELVEIESQMLLHAMEMTIKTMGPALTEAYPQATLPKPAHVMTFAEAEAVLGISGGESLTSEQERELGQIMEERGFELLAITQVPWKQRPFYHMREGAELTRSFEMIYRGIEITSGAVREHRHPVLMQQLVEKGLTGKGMEFYLESFKLGSPPHGGFGMGLARVVMLFLGLASIKEAGFIHRGPGRLTP